MLIYLFDAVDVHFLNLNEVHYGYRNVAYKLLIIKLNFGVFLKYKSVWISLPSVESALREEQIELVVIEFDPFIDCLIPVSILTCWSLKSALLNKKPNNSKIFYCLQSKFNLTSALSSLDKSRWYPPMFLHNCSLSRSAGEILSTLKLLGVGIGITQRINNDYTMVRWKGVPGQNWRLSTILTPIYDTALI